MPYNSRQDFVQGGIVTLIRLPRRSQRGTAATKVERIIFTTKDALRWHSGQAPSTKVKRFVIRILRVLRDLRGGRNQGDGARFATGKPEDPFLKKEEKK
jgi:hypothetical protein